MTRNVKKTFLPKSGMRKSKIQGMSKVSKVHAACCMLHTMLQGSTKYPMSKVSKEIKTSKID